MAIRHGRGRKATMPQLLEGQFAVTKDTKEVFAGVAGENMKLLDEKDRAELQQAIENVEVDTTNLATKPELNSVTQQLAETTTYLSHAQQNAEVIAHRGLNSIVNEQTILAYKKAYQYGIKSWECDVQNTSDGEFVLVHDKTFARTAGDNRVVTETSYADIRNIDSSKLVPSHSPSYVLSFSEFLRLAKSTGDVTVYPEISPFQQNAETKRRMVDLIVNNGMEKRCVIQSFKFTDFDVVREKSKVIKIGFLVPNLETFNNALVLAKEDGNAEILCDYTVLLANPGLVSQCAQKGIGLAAWTVNTYSDVKELQKIGVNRYMTDKLVGGVYI